MSLNVETGSGSSTSESYISVASADTYFSDRGNATWAALTTAQKEQSLRQASEFMFQRYSAYWDGYRNTSIQALDWPRSYVSIRPARVLYQLYVDNTIVPVEVQRACAELALKASTYTDGLLPDVEDLISEETIGPITTKYNKNSPTSRVYKSVDAMLSPYLKNGGVGSISITSQRA